jgi:hypothetical protein
MRDYTFNGVPVSQMPTVKIIELINDGGVHINNDGGLGARKAEELVMIRLRLELAMRMGVGASHIES